MNRRRLPAQDSLDLFAKNHNQIGSRDNDSRDSDQKVVNLTENFKRKTEVARKIVQRDFLDNDPNETRSNLRKYGQQLLFNQQLKYQDLKNEFSIHFGPQSAKVFKKEELRPGIGKTAQVRDENDSRFGGLKIDLTSYLKSGVNTKKRLKEFPNRRVRALQF